MKWTLTEKMLLRKNYQDTLGVVRRDALHEVPVFYREDIETRIETIAAAILKLEIERQILKNKLNDENNNLHWHSSNH